VDLALSDDDDQKPSNRPHVPNWICVKENCQDGGLQELTGNLAVTDVTGTLPSVTPLKNAETCMVTDVTALPTQSLRNAKISDEMTRDCIEETVVLGESGSNVCNERVTPTSEPTDDGCNVSNGCNAGDRVKVTANYPGTESEEFTDEHQVKMLADKMREAIASSNFEGAKEIVRQVNVSTSQLRASFWQNLDRTEEKNKARLLAFANLSEGTPVKYVGKIEQYAQEELTAYDADGHGHITCLLPNGHGFTTWIPTRDLRLPKS
jgi:hypothetical protein